MAMEFKRLLLQLCVFQLYFSSSFSIIDDQSEQNPERESLLSFKNSLENPNILSSWIPSHSHCQWNGVLCKNNQVISLTLPTQSLKGPISPSLFSLSNLILLDLSGNSFYGEISPQVSQLSKLKELSLGDNQLSGEIPSELCELTQLETLKLGPNFFTGKIPPEFGNLLQLRHLDLTGNVLKGNIPDELGNLNQLQILELGNNFLSGVISPTLFLKLQSLISLDVSNNTLVGKIPPEIGNLKNLTDLYIGINGFSGVLPPEIGLLSNLRNLFSPTCSFRGPLPEEIGELKSLSKLDLSYNPLKSQIPKSIGKLQNLSILNFVYSELNGSIPFELGNCMNLKTLMLSFNSLSGSLPESLSKLPMLSFSAEKNQLSGPVPSWIGKWTQIDSLLLSSNQFIGRIPQEIGNCTLLNHISLSNNLLTVEIGNAVGLQRLILGNNRLNGTIPKEIGNLEELSVLSLNSNSFEGFIPAELAKCMSLTTLDLGYNQLIGGIPEGLGDLAQLQCLVLSHNDLSGPIPSKSFSYFRQINIPDSSFVQHHGVFDLSHNRLSGRIPEELGNCVVVVDLLISNNRLSGEIPRSLSRITNLTTLDLSGNLLTGSIPPDLGFSGKLQGLYLAKNQLTGTIPASIGHIISLVKLNLTGNRLSGSIPYSFGNLNELTHLDLSWNELTGELPPSLSSMVNLVGLYVQHNRLTGTIGELFSSSTSWRIENVNLSMNYFNGDVPCSFGNLSYLTYLDLHGNMLTGTIPPDLGNLMQLAYFDVSDNKLSGQIPYRLCNLSNLAYFDLAGNRLEGPIPKSGICQNFTKLSLSGNKDLCGGILGLDCELKNFNRRPKVLNAWGIAGVVVGSLFFVLTLIFSLMRIIRKREHNVAVLEESKLSSSVDANLYYLSSSRSKEPLSINVAMFEQPLLKLTLVDILEATNNFCKTNIIGDGGFGTVYKATLPDGKTVAIKKLNQAKNQGNREFLAEMETIGKVKHRNLVSLLGYCSLGEEKLLVYEYMVNGSLDLWLRNRTGALDVLDWSKRFKIAKGAARGLAFLHHGFIPHIIHRDIKASNILLDDDFEPKVADFGLARLISACETHVSTDIAGTFGYIPPEYGQSWRSTTRGDVYSFGVILLELVTGKEPTGPDFKESEGGNLVGWVFQKIKKGEAADVLDSLVLNAATKHEMLQTLQIAAICLSENPVNRPTMLHVLKFLKGFEDV
ncbi:hypothetical protein AQUCO_01300379v1 [Aquilegia coerulea]|uniref:non-specific serine/threonine protein kinase n=1 Tax=Aquilegia coerulea TaxID=218851 RepID=A0A2G5E1C6_AQUCA|nr:hypothetical protein AQUCO_01300379v1 [Aquilegia coerulea]